MLIMHGVSLNNFDNLSITIKPALYPAVVVGNNTTRSIVSYLKGYSAGLSGCNNPPGTWDTTLYC